MLKRPLSRSERTVLVQARLAAYVAKIAAYRAQSGGLPPDREAHLNAWAAAKKEIPL